jgi:HlyD family secretion protein
MNDVTSKPPELQSRSLTVPRRSVPAPRGDNVAARPGSWSLLRAIWRHRWFTLFVLILLGLGCWQAARIVFGVAVVVDPVKRGDLVQTVVASGHVETPYRAEIGSQIIGTVQSVLVEEGERVRKGQPLIQIESNELESACANSKTSDSS